MEKVVVGISGGVDSAVCAILLKNKGYDVIGVTFIFTENFDPTDAIKVCEKINIKHYVIDYRKEFNKLVIQRFLNDYKSGITPNPCVICNRLVKIKFLHDAMKKYNCDYMATGHYAKIKDGKLYKSVDLNKDQTYFLSELSNEQINSLLLPLEGITKNEVREIATNYNLDNANKKDSTDVCFINSSFKNYISENVKNNPGDVVDVSTGKKLGTHKGLSYYTIGQRRGLDIGGMSDRLFVVGKGVEENILYVSESSDNDYLLSNSCIVSNFNYLTNQSLDSCKAKFRYRQEDIPVKVNVIDDSTIEVFYENAKAVTKGQTCTLYKDDLCLGGGTIIEVKKDGKKLWYL